jgi:hypothetical protein
MRFMLPKRHSFNLGISKVALKKQAFLKSHLRDRIIINARTLRRNSFYIRALRLNLMAFGGVLI